MSSNLSRPSIYYYYYYSYYYYLVQMESIPADFSAVPVDNTEAEVIIADPVTAHTDLQNAHQIAGKILLAKRGKASFATIGEDV